MIMYDWGRDVCCDYEDRVDDNVDKMMVTLMEMTMVVSWQNFRHTGRQRGTLRRRNEDQTLRSVPRR